MKARITKSLVDGLTPGPRALFVWDTELAGFGLKLTPAGTRVYLFQYDRGGRSRRVTIGRHGSPWTPHQARAEALRLKTLVVHGDDPADARTVARQSPTVSEFAARFLRDHVDAKLRRGTRKLYRSYLANLIEPQLGHLKLRHLTRADVTAWHLEHRATPGQANRALGVLSHMLTLAERWGVRPEGANPCRHVERFSERARDRFLTPDELARLGRVLADGQADGSLSWQVVGALRLLLLTGRRHTEVTALRWEHVDLRAASLRLPETKTGAKVFPLAEPALRVLRGVPRLIGSPWVFPGRGRAEFRGLGEAWRRVVRVRAGMGDVRIHDLRHCYASIAVQHGETLQVVGALLGHTTQAMTARYAHLGAGPVRDAAERVAGEIEAALRAPAAES